MMGETSKQVRVDNWGTFFLQRLQLFFNKTDYCDLTLQFEGNVQLKVHRLVINACTEYFHLLEQTCDVVDDVLIMPPDLQADVVVPIVNFMYTGMLEFQMSMFDKLYKTAELMNITVLTKLLDAQKQPFTPTPRINRKPSQVLSDVHNKKNSSRNNSPYLPATLPGRKIPVWKRKVAPTTASSALSQHYYSEIVRKPVQQDPLMLHDNIPKPTRFEWPDEDLSAFNPLDSTFDDISYSSRPLLTREDEMRSCGAAFDEVKYSGNFSSLSNQEEEEEPKDRSELLEYEDETMDDISEPYEVSNRPGVKRKAETSLSSSSKRIHFVINEKENNETTINVTPTGKSATEMNHTKIISELLKKYPHLVKKNKNIRLKIMAKSSKSPSEQKKAQVIKTTSLSKVKVQANPSKPVAKVTTILEDEKKEDGPWICHRCNNPNDPAVFVLYYLYRKHMTDVHNEKFDSRMCKYCGHKSNKHNMLMYHMYTKHGIKPPPAYNFPKCNQCHYVALTEALLIKHKLNHTRFELQCPECRVAFNSEYALTTHMQITGHTEKSNKAKYDCQYCIKRYQNGANLFSHIKMQHRDEARRDGIVSIDEIEECGEADANTDDDEQDIIREEDKYITPDIIQEKTKEKVKIISNVKVSATEQQSQAVREDVVLEPSSETNSLNNVANSIATSLGLVDIVVLDDNQQYILRSNDQQLVSQQGLQEDHQEFILPELDASQAYTQNQEMLAQSNEMSEHNVITESMLNSSDIASTDELVMVLTDHDYGDGNNELISGDNSNIVVLYSHPVQGQDNQFITTQSNLLVNSQTGMIEIQNDPTVSSSTADHLVVSNANDTDIESIELIQQEINSHNNAVKQEIDYETNQSVSMQSEPLSDKMLDENLGQNKAALQVQTVAQGVSEESTSQPHVESDSGNEGELIAVNIAPSQEQMDTTQPENSEQTTESSETAEHHNEQQILEKNQQMETEEVQKQSITEKSQVQNSETSPNEEHQQCISGETPTGQLESTTVEDIVSNKSSEDFSGEIETNCNIKDKNGTDLFAIQNQHEEETVAANDFSANNPVPSDENQSYAAAESSFEQEHFKDSDAAEDNGNATTAGGDNEADNHVGHRAEADTEDDIAKADSDSLSSQGDILNNLESHSQHSGNNEFVEENNQCSSFESQNETSRDDSSHSTQTSRESSHQQKDAGSKECVQSLTKVSILDDWEDTDSQQSTEHGKDCRSGNTVNKLMDDWADEDEDDKKNSL